MKRIASILIMIVVFFSFNLFTAFPSQATDESEYWGPKHEVIKLDIGTVSEGDRFTISLKPGERVLGTSMTLIHLGDSTFEIREVWNFLDGPQLIGDVAAGRERNVLTTSYHIYATVR